MFYTNLEVSKRRLFGVEEKRALIYEFFLLICSWMYYGENHMEFEEYSRIFVNYMPK